MKEESSVNINLWLQGDFAAVKRVNTDVGIAEGDKLDHADAIVAFFNSDDYTFIDTWQYNLSVPIGDSILAILFNGIIQVTERSYNAVRPYLLDMTYTGSFIIINTMESLVFPIFNGIDVYVFMVNGDAIL